ncbi:pilus assembly protein [Anaerolineales bacterium HSG25]|nr:pilus assembly protein [Anaerolineales bacterium HSG25]
MINKIKSFMKKGLHGQAMVEMAIITPLLILMLIGVFEVAWALRGYLVIVNVNREVTRRAVRPGYLDFSVRDANTVGYKENILTYFGGTSGGLDDPAMDSFDILPDPPLPDTLADGSGYLSVSYFVAHTGKPYENACANPDDCCQTFKTARDAAGSAKDRYKGVADNFTYDDIIIHPDIALYDYYTYTTYATYFSPSGPITKTDWTKIKNYEEEVYQFALENSVFNCELLHKGDYESLNPSNNNIVVTELSYPQNQLTRFPLYTNREGSIAANVGIPITDPVMMYSKMAMRLQSSARSGIDSTTIGPICAPLPIVGSESLKDAQPSFDSRGLPASTYTGNPINILTDATNKWIMWGDADESYVSSDEEYFKFEMQYPQMAFNEYEESDNQVLDAADGNDPVTTRDFTFSDPDEIEELIRSYAGQKIIIPIIEGGTFKAAAIVILDGNIELNNPVDDFGNPIDPYIHGYLVSGAVNECLDNHYCQAGDPACTQP